MSAIDKLLQGVADTTSVKKSSSDTQHKRFGPPETILEHPSTTEVPHRGGIHT